MSFLALLAVPRLLARAGATLTLVLASLGLAAALVLLAAVPTLEFAALGFLGVMTMSAVAWPPRNLFSQEVVAPQWRTTTSAILTVGLGMGWASTAAIGGYLIRSLGFGGLFLVSAALAVASVALLLAFGRLFVMGPAERAVHSEANQAPLSRQADTLR